MTNKLRGEVKIKVAGKQYVMRPTIAALIEIEEELGVTALDVLEWAADNLLSIKDMLRVARAGLAAGGHNFTHEQLTANLLPAEVKNLYAATASLLARGLGLGDAR